MLQSPLFRFLFIAPLLAAGSLHAEPLSLQTAQVKALGIETRQAGGSESAGSRYPARVLVPNAQMRVVSAPVAGMIEMLAVAPGSTVKRSQVVAHLASPQAL